MLETLLSPAAWLGALGIFALRVSDMTFDTLRMLFVVRGRKGIAWVLGFAQSVIFVIAITSVLSHLDNPLNVIGYAAGFATGNVVGMIIEERMAIGHIEFTIISSTRGAAVAEELRKNGYAVTEISARGRGGMVTLLQVNVLRKDMDNIETIVLEADPEAFVTANEVRPIRRGYWRA
jgi:uncharacterized protein YebE (UPF0316 family)